MHTSGANHGPRYTAMTYGDQILLSATNLAAIVGAAAYGNAVTPSVFDPPCDAYACVDGVVGCPHTYFNASPALDLVGQGRPGISQQFGRTDDNTAAYSLEL